MNQSAAQLAAASAEKTKEAEVKIKVEQQKVYSQKEKESLVIQVQGFCCLEDFPSFMHSPSLPCLLPFPAQIEELRMSVSRAEQQLAWKEDHMNQEIANVQTVRNYSELSIPTTSGSQESGLLQLIVCMKFFD